jgi:hypothetical protein
MAASLLPFRRRRQTPPQPARADAHAWASQIRAGMGWAGCGQPGHRIDTPFRRASKWPPVDECKLRDLARRQLDHITRQETPA